MQSPHDHHHHHHSQDFTQDWDPHSSATRLMGRDYTLVILAVDGTLTRAKSGEMQRQTPQDWEWLPGRREKCQQLREAGVTVISYVGAPTTAQFPSLPGNMTVMQEVLREWGRVAQEVGTTGVFYLCTHDFLTGEEGEQAHASCYDCQPYPGLLFKAMASTHALPAQTLFVGSTEPEEAMALHAGVKFAHADVFFPPYVRIVQGEHGLDIVAGPELSLGDLERYLDLNYPTLAGRLRELHPQIMPYVPPFVKRDPGDDDFLRPGVVES